MESFDLFGLLICACNSRVVLQIFEIEIGDKYYV